MRKKSVQRFQANAVIITGRNVMQPSVQFYSGKNKDRDTKQKTK